MKRREISFFFWTEEICFWGWGVLSFDPAREGAVPHFFFSSPLFFFFGGGGNGEKGGLVKVFGWIFEKKGGGRVSSFSRFFWGAPGGGKKEGKMAPVSRRRNIHTVCVGHDPFLAGGGWEMG